MGSVIEFLARLGQDASLCHASDETLAALVSEAGMDEAVTALRTVAGQGIYFNTQMGEPLREVEEPEDDEGDEGEDDDEEGEKSSRRGPKPPVPGPRH
ncbi:MAG TPA: hypothetical protein VM621_01480 [Luteibacter sp.]|uniref:hypothetical protein n=1 Tax=Luteibacter sp. TaxID=1886636 RepID=UPI002C596CC4|nr:hypothetical protein [Luteibacter sp.]HVI53705.1 hypothetical protein [Luteibacter sp.]